MKLKKKKQLHAYSFNFMYCVSFNFSTEILTGGNRGFYRLNLSKPSRSAVPAEANPPFCACWLPSAPGECKYSTGVTSRGAEGSGTPRVQSPRAGQRPLSLPQLPVQQGGGCCSRASAHRAPVLLLDSSSRKRSHPRAVPPTLGRCIPSLGMPWE